ncbi:MAG: hypothetical protein IPL47_09180 [Phyllobacteriaceae bacterium]|nr:hypothetical protein [Phyllobacteriaceae bacterium]
MSRATRTNFFKPGGPVRDKAATTESASRIIIEAEAAARAKKTERLRKLRLAAEIAAGEKVADKT